MNNKKKKPNISSKCEIGVPKSQNRKKKNHTQNINKENQAGPSTSDPGLASSEKYLAPFALIDSSEDKSDEEMAEKDKCCVCKRFCVNSRNVYEVAFVRWAKCETCGHWVHLRYCTPHVLLEEIHLLNVPVNCEN